MKRTILILLFSIFTLSGAFSQTEDAYHKAIVKMFKVSGSEETYKTAIKQIIDMFKKQNNKIADKYWEDVEGALLNTSLMEIVDLLVPVYKKYLNQEEVEAMISFYQTPAGQQFSKNTHLIMQESMQVGQQWGRKLGEEITKIIKEKSN